MLRKQKYKTLLYVFLTLLLLVVSVIGGQVILSAFADTSGYTSALEDLQKDSFFVIDDYPRKVDDYSIQVIQISESTSGELFVYTYQPCQKVKQLIATEINMSLTDSADGTQLFDLVLLDSSDVFCKYKVNRFVISSAATRYYNITSISREWIKGVDTETGNDNIKNAVAFNVGKCYRVKTENGSVKYECKETETIQIINPYHDFLEYPNGFKFFSGLCHSHYIAFTTDKNIDDLLEADVSYSYQVYEGIGGGLPSGTPETTIKTIDNTQTGESYNSWFSSKKREWDRIEKAEDFVKNEKLNSETEKVLSKEKWVVRFLETPYKKMALPGTYGQVYSENKVIVSDVGILRLKFVTDGKVYNLGAISDKVTSDDKPGNVDSSYFQPVVPKEEKQGLWSYIWNCIVKLFTGRANAWEKFVAVGSIIVAVIVFVIAVMFVKWIYRGLFK